MKAIDCKQIVLNCLNGGLKIKKDFLQGNYWVDQNGLPIRPVTANEFVIAYKIKQENKNQKIYIS